MNKKNINSNNNTKDYIKNQLINDCKNMSRSIISRTTYYNDKIYKNDKTYIKNKVEYYNKGIFEQSINDKVMYDYCQPDFINDTTRIMVSNTLMKIKENIKNKVEKNFDTISSETKVLSRYNSGLSKAYTKSSCKYVLNDDLLKSHSVSKEYGHVIREKFLGFTNENRDGNIIKNITNNSYEYNKLYGSNLINVNTNNNSSIYSIYNCDNFTNLLYIKENDYNKEFRISLGDILKDQGINNLYMIIYNNDYNIDIKFKAKFTIIEDDKEETYDMLNDILTVSYTDCDNNNVKVEYDLFND